MGSKGKASKVRAVVFSAPFSCLRLGDSASSHNKVVAAPRQSGQAKAQAAPQVVTLVKPVVCVPKTPISLSSREEFLLTSRRGAGAGIRLSSSGRVEKMLPPRQRSPKVESSNAGSRKGLLAETWHLRLRGQLKTSQPWTGTCPRKQYTTSLKLQVAGLSWGPDLLATISSAPDLHVRAMLVSLPEETHRQRSVDTEGGGQGCLVN